MIRLIASSLLLVLACSAEDDGEPQVACEYCNPNFLPYDNMNAALYGYDVSKADPFSTSAIGGDPGWRNPILVPTIYKDGVVQLHPSIDGRDQVQCNVGYSKTDVTNMKQYKEEQMTSSYTGRDMQLGQELELDVKVSIPKIPGGAGKLAKAARKAGSKKVKDTLSRARNKLPKSGRRPTNKNGSPGTSSNKRPNSKQESTDDTNSKKKKDDDDDDDDDDGDCDGIACVGLKTKIPPFLRRSSSNVENENEIKEFFTVEFGSMVIMQATCSVSVVKVLPHTVPQFHPGFKQGVLRLWTGLSLENTTEGIIAFKKFVDDFGTHYSKSTTMGSKMVYQMRVTQSEKNSMTQKDINKAAEVNGLEVFGFQVEKDSKTSNKSNALDTELSSSKVSRERFTTFGSKPAENSQEWAEASGNQPVPLKMELIPVFELLTDEALYEIFINNTLNETAPTRLEFMNLTAPYWDNLCEIVYDEQVCEPEEAICGYKDNCLWGEECVVDENLERGYYCNTKKLLLQCHVNPDDRVPCESYAANQLDCESQKGCCWDEDDIDKRSELMRCYKRAEADPCSINPTSRLPADDSRSCTTPVEKCKYVDYDYRHHWQIYSADACMLLCRNDLRCQAYNYNAESRRCWLETAAGNRQNVQDANELCGTCPSITETDYDDKPACLEIGGCYDKWTGYDETAPVCFRQRLPAECSVNPNDRIGCGPQDITPGECLDKDCCYNKYKFDPQTHNETFCFQPVEAASECSVNPADRVECGWPTIKEDECKTAGCCFVDDGWGKKCFHPETHATSRKLGKTDVVFNELKPIKDGKKSSNTQQKGDNP